MSRTARTGAYSPSVPASATRASPIAMTQKPARKKRQGSTRPRNECSRRRLARSGEPGQGASSCNNAQPNADAGGGRLPGAMARAIVHAEAAKAANSQQATRQGSQQAMEARGMADSQQHHARLR